MVHRTEHVQKTKNHKNDDRMRQGKCMYLFCTAERECPLAHFVFLVSTQQTYFVSIQVLWESCQRSAAEPGLRHKALSHAFSVCVVNESYFRTTPIDAYKA